MDRRIDVLVEMAAETGWTDEIVSLILELQAAEKEA